MKKHSKLFKDHKNLIITKKIQQKIYQKHFFDVNMV